MIEARRPDIVVVDKVKKETILIDVAIPGDREIHLVKRRNCLNMANEKGRCDFNCSWSIRNYKSKI